MLRDFQNTCVNQVFQAWDEGAINVMLVSPTGSGKTVMVGDIAIRLDVPTCAIAHRQELVGQLALAFNRENVPHGIIAPKAVIQQIIALEMEEHGYSRYNPRANVRVAGVDTLIKRDASDRWFQQVLLVIIDEGHHVLRDNKWGRAFGMFPNARGLFPTAHAVRADGMGLGRSVQTADGLVDRLVIGPCARELIDRGFLTDYRLICPPSSLDLSQVPVGPSGEYNYKKLRGAVHQAGNIVGNVVDDYIRFAGGKLGITFAVDIEDATSLVTEYRKRNVRAEIITGNTDPTLRGKLMKKFRARDILQLVSVDVLGEGVDVPTIEVVSMARPTASFQLYAQQFGRSLRPVIRPEVKEQWGWCTDAERVAFNLTSPKPKAIILDHVGNCHHFYPDHGFVDTPQRYSLNRREKATRVTDSDAIPLRTCLNPACLLPYEAVLGKCPHCKTPHVPTGRTKPEQVDGDIEEIDPAVLKAMRDEVARIDSAPVLFPKHAPATVIGAIKRTHRQRQEAQATLRDALATWDGWSAVKGRDVKESQRRFFYKFGVDVLSAQALNALDANSLEARIRTELELHNIVRIA